MVAPTDQLSRLAAPGTTPEVGSESMGEMEGMAGRIRGVVRRRVLLVFVGGTGLNTLDVLARDMERHGERFGGEVEAIFADTDISAIAQAEGKRKGDESPLTKEEEDREREFRMLSRARGLGAHVCDISLSDRAGYLNRTGLIDELSEMPAVESVEGAKACPTVGYTCYIAARERDDANSPRVVAKSILMDWLSAQKGGGLGKETSIIVVSGSHGGTGPAVSRLVMADLKDLFEKRLKGQHGTLLNTERILVTSEAAGIDRSLSNDGHQLRRNANCAMEFIITNATANRRSVQITRDEFIKDGAPTRTYFIGAGNSRCQVDPDGGHQGPPAMVAKLLRLRTGDLGEDIGATARANTDPETPEQLGLISGPTTENRPLKMLCTSGVTEVLPDPDKGIITRDLRRTVFTNAVGLTPNSEKVSAEVAQTFPAGHMGRLVDGFTFRPLMADSLDQDTVKTQIGRSRTAFGTGLEQTVPGYLQGKRDELVGNTDASVAKLKFECGLRPTLDFVTESDAELEAAKTYTDNELSGNCSDRALRAASDRLELAIKDFLAVKQGGLTKLLVKATLVDGSEHEQKLDDAKTALAEAYNALIGLMRNRAVLTMWREQVYDPMKRYLSGLQTGLRAEVAAARQVFADIKIDPKERPMVTPFDIGVEVHPSDGRFQDMPGMRHQYFERGWTEEAMRNLVGDVVSTDDDINLLGEMDSDLLLDLDEYSIPPTRPVGMQTTVNQIGKARSYDVTVPVDDLEEAKRFAPDGAIPHAVGRGGRLEAVRTIFGMSMLEDSHIRQCLKDVLSLPPTKAAALKHREYIDPDNDLTLYRDALGQRRGEFRDKALPVFRALAEREKMENGGKGEVAVCPGEGCDIPFYLSPEARTANVTCCPSCRKIQGK
jgi:hypothetical protein